MPAHAGIKTNPGVSRGGVGRIVIALAAPHRFSIRRLARLFEHEVTHSKGVDHSEMSHNVLMSLGPIPDWAKNVKIRYRGRAPSQIP